VPVRRASAGLPGEPHALVVVGFHEAHLDVLGARRGNRPADEVGGDRQLAVAAVDQHGEPDRARPAVVHQRVERGAHRPAGVEHVVDQADGLVVDRLRQVGRAQHRLLVRRPPGADVVAVERDVERADLRPTARRPFHQDGEALGERHPALLHADQVELVGIRVALEDLGRHPLERAGNLGAIEHLDPGKPRRRFAHSHRAAMLAHGTAGM
jgi:hypothetical protein